MVLRHKLNYPGSYKDRLLQTNLFTLSQRPFVSYLYVISQSFQRDLRHRITYPVFHKDRSSQTNLFSLSVTMYTFVRDKLISLVFHKRPSSYTNLLSLSQKTFVRHELTQSFRIDLRHIRTYSVFLKRP